MGFKALNESEVEDLPPPDIILAEEALDKMEQLKQSQEKEPFFLALGYR